MSAAAEICEAAEALRAVAEGQRVMFAPDLAGLIGHLIQQAAIDMWAHGLPEGCDGCSGCHECDDLLYAPYIRKALAVARAINGSAS